MYCRALDMIMMLHSLSSTLGSSDTDKQIREATVFLPRVTNVIIQDWYNDQGKSLSNLEESCQFILFVDQSISDHYFDKNIISMSVEYLDIAAH